MGHGNSGEGCGGSSGFDYGEDRAGARPSSDAVCGCSADHCVWRSAISSCNAVHAWQLRSASGSWSADGLRTTHVFLRCASHELCHANAESWNGAAVWDAWFAATWHAAAWYAAWNATAWDAAAWCVTRDQSRSVSQRL